MSTIEQVIAGLTKAQKDLEILRTKERPLTLRGWRDDFLGDAIHEQYAPSFGGAGSATPTLQDNAHGGILRFVAGAGAARFSRLYLGSGAAYRTLDPDEGFIIITRARIVAGLANIGYDICSISDFGTDYLLTRYDTNYDATDWVIIARNGGAEQIFDSGVATDTDWHWHRLQVCSGLAYHYLDSALINTANVGVPDAPGEALLQIYSRGGGGTMDVDFWAVIPMNL